MKEINRQFVFFGNFNSIKIDDIADLKELKDEYHFQTSAMPDIIFATQPVQPNQIPIMQNLPIRPLFQTEDKSTTVFFGSTRIHVEQINNDSESFEDFKEMATRILNEVKNKFDLKINRVALNGQLYFSESSKMEKIFADTFKKSKLHDLKSNEWQARIVTKDFNQSLNCNINKIVFYSRGIFENQEEGMISSYDFNTEPGIDKIYNDQEISDFFKLGCEYRRDFIG